ncbi:hypothetical protein GCM10007913_09470 [Devosia yakushimensis]|uniref:Magnesium transporter MgtE intracellular domain-containing protein n=1 Tax=Devosia yakushimensis TaxID=470028 RepID=A0ABQ5UA59_9HYPH|nr:hypothetical protein [Devosia yakushimensis]GLQ09015.1 hypothetical protein GCM10007913_09470 [Devosia yakushimensis]
MKSVRLLPVVVMAIAALLMFKTIGLVTNGGYVLAGVTPARAAGATGGGEAVSAEAGEAVLEDATPTLSDSAPTLGEPEAAGGGHGAPAPAAAPAAEDHAAATPPSGDNCVAVDAALDENGAVNQTQNGGGHGEAASAEGAAEPATSSFVDSMALDCFPSGDAVPMQVDASGAPVPMTNVQGGSATEESILQSLAARRTELETYEKDLALRASLVDAAEQRVAERQATLEALEAQISSLVDQRQEMEAGQFASIVAMYETMKPRDAANIFNALDMEVLLRVAKTMNPRKMAPILAAMNATRAQELTVRMAALADQPAAEMTPDDLQALPQIVGQ